MYIDSHAHLSSESLFPQAKELIERALEKGVDHIINICTDRKSLEKGLMLHEQFPQVLNTGSTTPHDVEKEGEAFFKDFEQAALDGHFVAIGETGLDYFYEHSNRKLQQEFFIRYLDLAKRCQLPAVIHCRDAFDDFFEIIDQHFPYPNRGVLHCFTGSQEDANKLIERDWFISFSGIVTFKKSLELQDIAKKVPNERFLIETDSPYLAPQSKRGKPNEPSYVIEVAQKLAELKRLDLDHIASLSSKNAKRLFGLDS